MNDNVAGTGLSAERLRELGLGALVSPDLSPAFAALAEQELERLADLGRHHGLSVEEVRFCEEIGQDFDEYALYKGARSIDDVEAGKRTLELRRAARDEAEKQVLVDAERERLNNGKQE